jgi:2-iminobutanoate/2-iminopropanoate deaminase
MKNRKREIILSANDSIETHMTINHHNPPAVAAPLGGYSHGLEIRNPKRLLFISGQIPTTAEGIIPPTFDEQCHAVWNNITAVLHSAGMGIHHLVKVTTFLTHADQVAPNGDIRRQRLGDHRPALTVMIAQTLETVWMLEIEAIAAECE